MDTEAGTDAGRTCVVSLAGFMHVSAESLKVLRKEKKHLLGVDLRDSQCSQMLGFVQYYFDFVRV